MTSREVVEADSTEGDVDDGKDDEDEKDDDDATPEVLTFTDSALERAVRAALDKPAGDLTEADVDSLTRLGFVVGVDQPENVGVA